MSQSDQSQGNLKVFFSDKGVADDLDQANESIGKNASSGLTRMLKDLNAIPLTIENLSAQLRAVLAHLDIPPKEKLAVAVSGGSDSLALALAVERIAPVVALTVDHALRDDSEQEAKALHDQLSSFGVEHHILRWDGEKPTSNIQAEARNARYQLLEDWCVKHGITYLLTGHQRNDIAETFLLRLMRGSGVDGLAAMPLMDSGLYHMDKIKRVRPLINHTRQAIIDMLDANGISYITDPSNENERFHRVKVRHFLSETDLEGMTVDRLADTAERLRWARDALDMQTRDWFYRTVSITSYGSIRLSCDTLALAPRDVGLRLLSRIITIIAGHPYKTRLTSLIRVYDALLSDQFTGQSLGGVLFDKSWGNGVFLIREAGAMPIDFPVKQDAIYDGRWRITVDDSDQANGLTLGPLGEAGWVDIKARDQFEFLNEVRHKERLSLPALFKEGQFIGLALAPDMHGAGYVDRDGSGVKTSPYGCYVTLIPPFFEVGASQARYLP